MLAALGKVLGEDDILKPGKYPVTSKPIDMYVSPMIQYLYGYFEMPKEGEEAKGPEPTPSCGPLRSTKDQHRTTRTRAWGS